MTQTRQTTQVHTAHRWLDALALFTLASGILLFAVGRSSLGSLAAETYKSPAKGVSWVSRAELHDKQTRWGAGLTLGGVVLAIGAAAWHTAAARRQS
jgi:cytochrome b561